MKYIPIFVLLLITYNTEAQVSKESFDKAVDYVNCKSIELSLKSDKSYNQFINECPCNTTDFKKISSFLTSKGNLDKTLGLAKEIESIKKDYNNYLSKENAIDFLSQSIFSDKVKYKKICDFANIRKNQGVFDEFSNMLKSELPSYFSQPSPANIQNPQVQNGTIQNDSLLEEKVNSSVTQILKNKEVSKGKLDIITFKIDVLSIIITICLGFIIVYVISLFKSRNNNTSDRITKKWIEQKISESQFSNQGNNNHTISNLETKIQKLDSEIRVLKDQLDKGYAHNDIIQTKYEQPIQPEIKSNPEIFYLSTPNSDGTFNDSSASLSYKEGASIYKFTKIGNNKAKFQIDERDASIKLALQYTDKNIDPVCEAENAYNPRSNFIRTVVQGEAELLDDKWLVYKAKKAKIRYES